MSDEWIDRLTETWQTSGQTSGLDLERTKEASWALKRRALLQAIRFWGVLVLELGVSAVAFAYGWWLVAGGAILQGSLLMVAMVVTTALGLWVRRGQWRVSDLSPRAFLELEVRRARGRWRSVRLGWGILVGVVAYVGGSLWYELGPEAAPRLIVLAVVTAFYSGWLVLLGRRSKRDLAHSRTLLEDCIEDDAV